jgi:molybdenum cofactor biosynthesis protein A
MLNTANPLTDRFGRKHNYLRISLTERCNLRCFYCMPPEGVQLSPADSLMNAGEVFLLAREFVKRGVNKIRLTGGEPLVRKDFEAVIEKLAALPVELAITTNGILLDKYLGVLMHHNVRKINISLDSLQPHKFSAITRRDYFARVWRNIHRLLDHAIVPKINVVVIRGTNDEEITGFVELTRDLPLIIQFIEFMPFVGNEWQTGKTVYAKEVMEIINGFYGGGRVQRLADEPNDTSRNYRISGYAGSFGMINTVSNPFCDSCNRIRLTANGRIKNCLFSQSETDLLALLRAGADVGRAMEENILAKKKLRGGISDFSDEQAARKVLNNRSMVLIGG